MSFNAARSLVPIATVLLATACDAGARDPAAALAVSPLGAGDRGAEYESGRTTEESDTTASPAPGPGDVEALGRGSRAFAFELFRQVGATRADQNVVLSPYSVSRLLSLAFAGARRLTEAEMGAALHFDLPKPALHAAFGTVAQALSARAVGPDEAPRLVVGQALWVREDALIEQTFLDTAARYYDATPRPIDFAGDPELSRARINAWFAERTETRVRELLPAGAVSARTALVLTDAVSLDASFATSFDARATQPAPFTKLDGSTVSVATMLSPSAPVLYARGDNYQAIALPLAGDGLSLVAVLPDAGAYREVEDAASASWFDALRARLASESLSVRFPKLSARANLSLRQPLEALDMRSAFRGGDFSGICEEGLLIDDVRHAAALEVHEGGANGGAPSAEAPLSVRFDRPFIYAVVDASSGQIVLLGRVLDPRAGT